MSDALANVIRLRRAAAAARASGDADAAWLADRIQTYLDGAPNGTSLEKVLELAPRVGQRSWQKRAAIKARDAAIRRLASFYPAWRDRAAEVVDAATRYESGAWVADAELTAMPDAYAGTPNEWLFRAFVAGAGFPRTPKHVQAILERRDRK